MRVWALASCSGLLALAACSAEQSSSPNPSAAPLGGEDAAEINAQPGLIATASSPMAHPEVRPGQLIQGGYRYRLNRAVGPASTTARSTDQPIPQAAALRERLQRLRSQQGTRLSPATPVAIAPQPAALTRPTLSQPTAAVAGSAVAVAPRQIAPLTTPPRPTPIAPQANPSTATAPGFSSAALDPVESASTARTYPIAPLRHQGYSARRQQPAPVLLEPGDAAASNPIARLHGEALTVRQADSAPGATAIPEIDVRQDEPAELSDPGSTAAIGNPVPVSTLAVASPHAAAHRSSGSISLTPTPNPDRQAGITEHQSPGVATASSPGPINQSPILWESIRPGETLGEASPARALSESLPLNGAAPQADLVWPRSAPAETEAEATPEVAPGETAAIAPQTPESADPLTQPDAQADADALGDNTAPGLHHQSQLGSETVYLSPTADTPAKSLPIEACLSPRGQRLPIASEAQGSLASLPKFSPSSPDDPSLNLGAQSKDDPTTLCMEQPDSAPAITAPPAILD